MTGQQFYWAGTYSFKAEIPMFLKAIKKQIDLLLEKVDKMDKAAEHKF